MRALDSTKREAMYRPTSKVAMAVCVALLTVLLRNLCRNALVVNDKSFDYGQNDSGLERIAAMLSHRSWNWSAWTGLTALTKSQDPQAVMVDTSSSNTARRLHPGRTGGDPPTGQPDHDIEPTQPNEMSNSGDRLPLEKRAAQDTGNPSGFVLGLRTYLLGTGAGPVTPVGTVLPANPSGFVLGLQNYLLGTGGAPVTPVGTVLPANPSGFVLGLRTYLLGTGGVPVTPVETVLPANTTGFVLGLRTYLLGTGGVPVTPVKTVLPANPSGFVLGLRKYLLGTGGVPVTPAGAGLQGGSVTFRSGLRAYLLGGSPIPGTPGITIADPTSPTDPTLPDKLPKNGGKKNGKGSNQDATVPSGSTDLPDVTLTDPTIVTPPINATGGLKQPGLKGGVDQTGLSGDVNQPGLTGDVNQPGLTGDVNQPGLIGGVNQSVSIQNPIVPSGNTDNPNTPVVDPSLVTQPPTPVSTGDVNQPGLTGGVNQSISIQNPTVPSGSTDNSNTTVADPSTQPPTPVSTGEVSQPGSPGAVDQPGLTGQVNQSASTQNPTVPSGSTDNSNKTVADPSTQPPTPVSTGEVSQPGSPGTVSQPGSPGAVSQPGSPDAVNQPIGTTPTPTSADTAVATQSSLSTAELIAIIQTLLSIINGQTPKSPDALAKVTDQLSKAGINTSTTQAQNTTVLQTNVVEVNLSRDSSPSGADVQKLNQTGVVEAAPIDPGSNSTASSSSDIKSTTLLSGKLSDSSNSSSLDASDLASSNLTTKDSSPGALEVSSGSSSVNSSDQQSPALRARNLESRELNGLRGSSSMDSTVTVIEDTARRDVEAPPNPASILNTSPTQVLSSENPYPVATGILERSYLLKTFVPTMSSNSESGTLYGLSLKSAPKNVFYNLGFLQSERSKELKVYENSFLRVFVN